MKKDYNNELIKVKHGSRFHKISIFLQDSINMRGIKE